MGILNQDTTVESGHSGALISLGGITNQPHQGRQITLTYATVPTTRLILVNDNPKRISLLIVNQKPSTLITQTDIIGISFKNSAATLLLNPGDALQIDNNFPTTTQVSAVANSAVATINTVEISVQ